MENGRKLMNQEKRKGLIVWIFIAFLLIISFGCCAFKGRGRIDDKGNIVFSGTATVSKKEIKKAIKKTFQVVTNTVKEKTKEILTKGLGSPWSEILLMLITIGAGYIGVKEVRHKNEKKVNTSLIKAVDEAPPTITKEALLGLIGKYADENKIKQLLKDRVGKITKKKI